MFKNYFGKRRRMRFDTQEEYFETLGFLAKSDGSIELYLEPNEQQGAWGNEARIHCISNLLKFTEPLKRKFTKGRGKKVLHRINCNEFVKDLIKTHAFQWGKVQNSEAIRSTIPNQYLPDFDRGYNL